MGAPSAGWQVPGVGRNKMLSCGHQKTSEKLKGEKGTSSTIREGFMAMR